jgi:hypothetical protein
VLGIKTVVAFLRDSRGSLGFASKESCFARTLFYHKYRDLVKYDAHRKELAIEIAKIVQRYENMI